MYVRVNEEIRPGRILVGKIVDTSVRPTRRAAGNMWADHVCRPLSIPAEQATPERIARENAAARKHGTGAVYDRDGNCHLPTRGSRAREMRRLNRQDNSAGYGDWAGR